MQRLIAHLRRFLGSRTVGKKLRLVLPALLPLPLFACQCDDSVGVLPGDVIGQVCDEATGAPLGSVLVRLETRTATRDALTTGDGRYTFAKVPPGPVSVIHVDSGRAFEGLVQSGENSVVTDSACRGTPGAPGEGGVEGQICNRHTGSLIQNGTIVVSTAGGAILTSETDDQGRFSMPDVPAGEHVLTVQAEGFQRAFLIDVVDGETYRLDLAEECIETDLAHGTLSGALCDPNDPQGVLTGATVVATDASGFVVEDLTDLNGEFFINAMAPGPATVRVTRGSDVNLFYAVDVVAGEDTLVARELTCSPDGNCEFDVVVEPVTGARPIDIIFVVDDSGSMDDDNQAIGSNMNAFSQQIASSGVDYRVVLVGTTNVPAPLGGSAQYLNIDTSVDSNDALIELVNNYQGYAGFLREDAVKHFVAITDDESDMSSQQFTNTVNTWPGFTGWKFHSIVAYGNDPQNGCSTGAAYSHQYMNLSAATGGMTSPICGANYATVFGAVVEAVTVATLPCEIPLTAPAGTVPDAARVTVTYEGVSAAVGAGSCGEGWRLDNPSAPTAIVACPTTCAELTSSAAGALSATVGCRTP